jgi:hypothetical protein
LSKLATAEASAQPATPELPQHLNEFCARLSATVKRPELIGAFEHHERTGGRVSATESEFKARFDAFRNKPV